MDTEFQSLKNELTTIFGVPKLRKDESWTCAMLRQITEQLVNERGQGVIAGKKEALNYSEDEKLNYVKYVAYSEGFHDAQEMYKK